MAIEAFPVKYELYDGDKIHIASIETRDEGAASISVHEWVNDRSWPELSAKIQECLVLMRLGE